MKRNGSRGLAKKSSTRAKAKERVAPRKKVQRSAKEHDRQIARGRQALKEAFEIGASFKADPDVWKWIAEDKGIEYG